MTDRRSLFERLTRALLPDKPDKRDDRTDVDFRPLTRPGPDVIAGWERRPHVPGAQGGDVR
jgi:hypothetical protein